MNLICSSQKHSPEGRRVTKADQRNGEESRTGRDWQASSESNKDRSNRNRNNRGDKENFEAIGRERRYSESREYGQGEFLSVLAYFMGAVEMWRRLLFSIVVALLLSIVVGLLFIYCCCSIIISCCLSIILYCCWYIVVGLLFIYCCCSIVVCLLLSIVVGLVLISINNAMHPSGLLPGN